MPQEDIHYSDTGACRPKRRHHVVCVVLQAYVCHRGELAEPFANIDCRGVLLLGLAGEQ